MKRQSAKERKLETAMLLIGSIFFYGKFRAETAAERQLEAMMREMEYFFESETALLAALANIKSKEKGK